MNNLPLAFPPKEAARLLSVCKSTLYLMIHDGEITRIRVRGRPLVAALRHARWIIANELENRKAGYVADDDPPEYLAEPEAALAEIAAALKLAEAANG